MSPSPRLSRCLVAKNDHSYELFLDDKPCRLIGDFSEFIQALLNFPERITSVHLHSSFVKELSESQKVELFDSLVHLEELNIASATVSAPLLTRILKSAPGMQRLCMERVVFIRSAQDGLTCQEDFYLALSGLQNLQEFHLCLSAASPNIPEGMRLFFQDGDKLDNLFQSLSSTDSLKKFYLSVGRNTRDNFIEPSNLKTFAAQASVEDMTLVNCHLNEEQCMAIATSPSLVSLSLINAGLGPEGALVMAQALPKMTSLKKLYLPENKIMSEAAAAIAQASSNLQVLDLHDNNLKASFAKTMAANLGVLKFLDISCNPLGDAGAGALAESLSVNTNLAQLNLYDTNLSDKSCKVFATTLCRNQTMKRLNLYKNQDISSAGVKAFVQTLEASNYTLERLEVSKDRELEATLEVYLKLNRKFGRRQLLAPSTTDEQYFEGIQKAVNESDLSSIFYLMQQRPSLHTSLNPSCEPRMEVPTSSCIVPTKLFSAAPRPSLKDYMVQGMIFTNPQA